MLRPVALAALALLVAGTARAQPPGPLVGAAWLAAHRDEVRVVEVHPEGPGEATIPGAAVVGMDQLRASFAVGAERFDRLAIAPAAFDALMARLDVDADDSVVVAWTGEGASGAADAAYLYWQLRYYGHDAVALLDGGVAAVAPIAAEMAAPPARAEGPAFAAEPRTGFNVTTPELAALVADGAPALVDNRPLAFHVGLKRKSYVARDGHIPGSALFPFTFMVEDGERAVFRSPERFERLADDLGVSGEGPFVVYCNSGRVSALGWFVLNELAGREAVLYDGSLHAWAQDEARPMTTALRR